MRDQWLLNLFRKDVFTTPKDHVLYPADNLQIAIAFDNSQISGTHEALAVTQDDGLLCCLLVVPVALHHAVPCCPDLPGHAAGLDFQSLGVHDEALRVGQNLADGRASELNRGPRPGLPGHGRGLGHAVADCHVLAAHVVDDPVHGVHWTEGTSHDPSSKRGELEVLELGVVQHRDEHGGDSVHRCATMLCRSLKRHQGVELQGWIHKSAAIGHHRHVGHDAPEAVVEGDRSADDLILGEVHVGSYEVAVVQNVFVHELGRLGATSGPRCELDVHSFIRGLGQFWTRTWLVKGLEAQHARHIHIRDDDVAQRWNPLARQGRPKS
mmetsp:Transcript_39142/g.83325  ORF Transcript_39142/g.83325 Transcript_39142/m.83325 type:complete len:324 (+) Transcript_39142:535-1506(+)